METPGIAPLTPSIGVRSVVNDRGGGNGGQAFEKALGGESEPPADGELAQESGAGSPDLKGGTGSVRKDKGDGTHRVNIVV